MYSVHLPFACDFIQSSRIGLFLGVSSLRSLRTSFPYSFPIFFSSPAQSRNEIGFMALFSSIVDNIYCRLLVVERDSRYYSEIMEPLCPFHVVLAEEKKRPRSGYWPKALIRFEVGKIYFPEGPPGRDSTGIPFLSFVLRKWREIFAFKARSEKNFKYLWCLQVQSGFTWK